MVLRGGVAGPELRGKPVRERNSGAAPATVSGEPTSTDVTEAEASGRRTKAVTREPGDLPRQSNVHGRGVPVAAARPALPPGRSAHLPLTPQQSGYGMSVSHKVPIATLGLPRIG